MGQTNGCDIRLPLNESFYFKDGKNNRVVKRINEIMFSKKNNLTPIDNEKSNSKKVHYACYFRVEIHFQNQKLHKVVCLLILCLITQVNTLSSTSLNMNSISQLCFE